MKTITTKEGFVFANVTEESDEFLQEKLGDLFIFHEDESESLINDFLELSEAVQRENIIVVELGRNEELKKDYEEGSQNRFRNNNKQTYFEWLENYAEQILN
jgi:hypothetical protein